jgi:CDP-glycerol glycerophosphotransferase (TagB/SpsB family)
MIFLEVIIFILSNVFKKNENIILFGAWGGRGYSDNSKVMFEKYRACNKDKAYFITKDKKNANLEDNVVYAYSIKGVLLHIRAKVFIYSSGYSDFIRGAITSRSIKINLWHGVPLKKIGYEDELHQPKALKLFLRDLRNFLLPFTSNRPNYVFSPTSRLVNTFKSAFRPIDDVLISGLPRNETLKNSEDIKESYILYMPTFRDSDYYNYFDTTGFESYVEYLKSQSLKLYVKLHPADKFNMHEYESEVVINVTNSDKDLYEDLIKNCNVLITDYSSVMFDFRSARSELIVFAPDLECYIKNSRSLYINFDTLTTNSFASTWLDVLSFTVNSQYAIPCRNVPQWAVDSPNTNYIEDTYNAIENVRWKL